MKTKTKASQLFQLFDKTFQDEKFCFHAEEQKDAESKMIGWLSYHGFLSIRSDYCVKPVDAPKYTDNIHDEWVD